MKKKKEANALGINVVDQLPSNYVETNIRATYPLKSIFTEDDDPDLIVNGDRREMTIRKRGSNRFALVYID